MKSERVAVGDHEITKRQRYREIVAVLARHGFGVVDDRVLKHETKDQARAEHLRLAREELGTLFIKLGQMLSTRSDICRPHTVQSSRRCKTTSRRCPRS
jgi:predicted unusual protein kinase regulating ubiquinone biosynthesis (AarF/ABC1/UbiB family)